jgi:hypothetical protein
VRLTYGRGVASPNRVGRFAVGLEYPVFAGPYGDLVSWYSKLVDAEDEYWVRVGMFLPGVGVESQVVTEGRVIRRFAVERVLG